MTIQYVDDFQRTLELLDEHNLLDHLVLIGSWAEFIYEKCNIINDFVSTTKTFDLDFLIMNINRPRNGVKLITIFEENDYFVDQSRNGIVVFRKKEFEVEFLARQVGKPQSLVESKSFGIKVEALSHMAMIHNNVIDVSYEEIGLKVPDPYAFLIHKMIINPKRKEKKEKDLLSIRNLYLYLSSDSNAKERFTRIVEGLTKKEKNQVSSFMQENKWSF